ncbi:hypothetical protein BKA82DRAFT_4017665 [Pisolithus tinctorius]|nr:hypothetical protein BKA82DRAFT_4017665 [Pisolithus tinctorius]
MPLSCKDKTPAVRIIKVLSADCCHTAALSAETLTPIRHAIELWHVDWQPEDRWPDKLEILKESVHLKSDPAALSCFWAGMRAHIKEAKEILSHFHGISHASEVKFFEMSLSAFQVLISPRTHQAWGGNSPGND